MAGTKKIDCSGFANRPEAWGSLKRIRDSLMGRNLQFTIEHTVNPDGSFKYIVSSNGLDVSEPSKAEKAEPVEPPKVSTDKK